MKNSIYIFLAVMALVTTSCRQHGDDALNPDSTAMQMIDKYVDLFDVVWNGINSSYVFWDVDSVDWDERYDECLPLFQAFDQSHEKGDTVKLAQYKEAWQKVLAQLTDHHLYVKIKNPHPANGENDFIEMEPGGLEVKSREGYHPSSQKAVKAAMDTMSLKGRISDGLSAYCGDSSIYVVSCLIDSSVAYYHSDRCFLYAMKTAEEGSDYAAGWKVFENWKQLVYSKARGAIIDMRTNWGGYCADLGIMLSPFLTEDLNMGQFRTKQGMGRMDYSPWSDMICPAMSADSIRDIPVVVLCDCNSVSMAELTAYAVSLMPRGTVVGERTYGATGSLVPGWYELTFSGVFGNVNGYYYFYTSTFEWHSHDGCLEGIGVTPDIIVPYDSTAFATGNDVQLEEALNCFKN